MTDVASTGRIGSIDLGHMGGPMAADLVAAGHDVLGFDRSAEGNQTARAAGW